MLKRKEFQASLVSDLLRKKRELLGCQSPLQCSANSPRMSSFLSGKYSCDASRNREFCQPARSHFSSAACPAKPGSYASRETYTIGHRLPVMTDKNKTLPVFEKQTAKKANESSLYWGSGHVVVVSVITCGFITEKRKYFIILVIINL